MYAIAVAVIVFFVCSVESSGRSPDANYNPVRSVQLQSANGMALRDHYVFLKGIVESLRQCETLCHAYPVPLIPTEVFHAEVIRHDIIRCTCAGLLSIYLLPFPRRYLVPASGDPATNLIFYRKGADQDPAVRAMRSNLPVLFFALDSITGGTNLGTAAGVSVDFGNSSSGPHLDCPFEFPPLPVTRPPNFLRLVPSESPLFTIRLGNVSFHEAGFTAVMWFRRRANSTAGGPLAEAHRGSTATWSLSNPANSDQLEYFMNGRRRTTSRGQFGVQDWNNLSQLTAGSNHSNFVNGSAVTIERRTGEQASPAWTLGDTIYLGRSGAQGPTFDGCLGHFIMFDKRLELDDLRRYGMILEEKLF